MRDLLAWFFASTLLAHSVSAQHFSHIANVNEQLSFGAFEEKNFAGTNNLTALVAMASTSSGADNGNLFANASSLSSSDLISLFTGTKLIHLWMALGSIMLLLLVYVCRREARDRRVRDKWRRKKERAQEKEMVEERNKGNQPQSSALQRCTLDGIATSCTQSGEGCGVQTLQVRMASLRLLPAPAEANLSKLSTPIELLPPLPAQAATFSNGSYLSSTSSLWKDVDEVDGSHAADDVDELALAVSRAVLRAMPHGTELFTCRPSSPISWQRTPEEDAFNGECKCRSMPASVCSPCDRYAALLFVLMRLVPLVHGVQL
jgi:hypothetical protein